jgi:serine/threonine protein kinase
VPNDAEHKRTELNVGDVVGNRYELRRELGRGAGGLVFEAIHQLTQRVVALKILSPDIPRSQIREQSTRLLREARALAAIRHSGVVEVLDAGLLEDGSPFIVLEKLDGRTLESFLTTRGKISREDAVAVGLQLAEALDTLHHAGIVHRDLKPGNVFIVRDRDAIERVKLLDFGIAQVASAGEDKLTGLGALIGTPAYMAPEQLLALDVDHRADVYALGVTVFECMTGHLPYEGNYQSVLLQVCSEDTRVPKVTDFAPEIGPDLARVVHRAITRKITDRTPTALDFGRELYEALPSARSRTFLLGPPPMPRFGPRMQPGPATAQRRRSPRAPYVTPVQLLSESAAVIEGRSEDISEGGVLVLCHDPVTQGEIATVRLALPIGGKMVSCKAHVRWIRAARPNEPEGPRAIGLEFIDAPEPMRASIASYVLLMSGQEARRTNA